MSPVEERRLWLAETVIQDAKALLLAMDGGEYSLDVTVAFGALMRAIHEHHDYCDSQGFVQEEAS